MFEKNEEKIEVFLDNFIISINLTFLKIYYFVHFAQLVFTIFEEITKQFFFVFRKHTQYFLVSTLLKIQIFRVIPYPSLDFMTQKLALALIQSRFGKDAFSSLKIIHFRVKGKNQTHILDYLYMFSPLCQFCSHCF